MAEGSKTVISESMQYNIVEPWKAGEYDPPMQDWLRLPVGDNCPVDSAHQRWGTRNPRGYFPVRVCGVCRAEFRPVLNLHMVSEIVDALNGIPRRFGIGRVAPEGRKEVTDA